MIVDAHLGIKYMFLKLRIMSPSKVVTAKSPSVDFHRHNITESVVDLSYEIKKPLCLQASWWNYTQYLEMLSGVPGICSVIVLLPNDFYRH